MMIIPSTLLSFLIVLTPCVFGLGTIVLPGDVYIEFIGDMYSDVSCTLVESQSVQNMQAVKWTLENLNKDDNFFPSVDIGLKVSATCGSATKARQLAAELAAEVIGSDTCDIVGVIGASNSDETEVISRLLSALPEQYRLLQISFASTSVALRDRNIYKNFFRTIPADDIQVEVMKDLLLQLNWTYVTAIYDNNEYGRVGFENLKTAVKELHVCFPEVFPVDDRSLSYITKILNESVFQTDKVNRTNASTTGILVFGLYTLSTIVLKAVENIIGEFQRNGIFIKHPTFIFSESAVYIEGQFPNISLGAFIPSPRRLYVEQFQNELLDTLKDKVKLRYESNMFLKELYEQLFNCYLGNSFENDTCPSLSAEDVSEKFQSSQFNNYAIQAVFALALAVKDVHVQVCESKEGVCENFNKTSITKRNMFFDALVSQEITFDTQFGDFRIEEFRSSGSSSPNDLAVAFDETCDMKTLNDFPVYEVFNHQLCGSSESPAACLIKVAEYKYEMLHLNTEIIRDYDEHGKNLTWPNIRKPQCPDGQACPKCIADIETESVLFIEGDLYIVGVVPVHNIGETPMKCGTMKKGGLDVVEAMRYEIEELADASIRVGIIVIDSCNDPQIAQERLLTLYKQGVNINGEFIPVKDKILGIVGGWSNDVSVALASVTTRLKQVQISYGSTSSELGRNLNYPYFLRIPSADDKKVVAMIEIVNQLKGNYIQILYSGSKCGETGLNQIRETVEDRNICIANEIEMTTTGNATSITSELYKEQDAKIVLVIVSDAELKSALFPLSQMKQFLFIISDECLDTELSESPKLEGAILVTKNTFTDTNLKARLHRRIPKSDTVDPWIRPYVESMFNCYYEWSYNKTIGLPCTGTERLGNDSYVVSTLAPFAQEAVKVLSDAAKFVVDTNCKNKTVVCDDADAYKIVTRLMTAENRNSKPVFDDNGDGTQGFKFFIFRESNYEDIGSNESGEFRFSASDFTLNSTCKSSTKCLKCSTYTDTNTENNFPVGAIAVIVVLGLICCSLAAFLLYICNRHGCCFRIEQGRLTLISPYITPVHRDRQSHGPIDGGEHHELHNHGEEPYDDIEQYRGQNKSRVGDGSSEPGDSRRYDRNFSRQQSRNDNGIINETFDNPRDDGCIGNASLANVTGGNDRIVEGPADGGYIAATTITLVHSGQPVPAPVAHSFKKTPVAPDTHMSNTET